MHSDESTDMIQKGEVGTHHDDQSRHEQLFDQLVNSIAYLNRPNCPVCWGAARAYYRSVLDRDIGIEFYQCRECRVIYMDPVPTQEWYNKYYATVFHGFKAKKKKLTFGRARKEWIKEVKRGKRLYGVMKRHGISIAPGYKILEIGCAYGFVVRELALRLKGQAFGVEPSKELWPTISNKANVEVVAANLDDLSRENQSFDMIVLSHVLENIVDLDKVLGLVHGLLTVGGKVVIDTPNQSCTKSYHLHHPHVFGAESLVKLFGRFDLEVLAVEESGEPNACFLPQYITVVVQKIENSNAQEERAPGNFDTSYRQGAGGARVKLWSMPPLRNLDRLIAQYAYRLPERTLAELEKLEKLDIS